jgi:nucleotidyltransferase substrate binding protein (TIGR01987 family)
MSQNEPRWKQRFSNFSRAFSSLEESITAAKKDPNNRFIKDSVIQRYEYTIELAWKLMKDYLEELGFIDVSAPKQAIRKAFKENIIKDAEAWIKALNDRNKTSHIYEEAIADEITKDIIESHYIIFADLYNYFRQEI